MPSPGNVFDLWSPEARPHPLPGSPHPGYRTRPQAGIHRAPATPTRNSGRAPSAHRLTQPVAPVAPIAPPSIQHRGESQDARPDTLTPPSDQPEEPAKDANGGDAGQQSTRFEHGKPVKSPPDHPILRMDELDGHEKMWLGVSPGKVRKVTMYDRFIPKMEPPIRSIKAFEKSKVKHLDAETLAYQEDIARACGVALNQRILTYGPPPTRSRESPLRASWNRPLRPTTRKIKKEPEITLDAPGMSNDYYLTLLDWSLDNKVAVALGDSIYVWDGDTGEAKEFCKAPGTSSISSLKYTADGNFLAVGLDSGAIQIWSMATGTKQRTMKGRYGRVGVLAWDNNIVSSGGKNGLIWNHDTRMKEHKICELSQHTSEVCGLAWRQDSRILASGGNDNTVVLWDARSSRPQHVKNEHKAAVKALAFCPWDMQTLATGGGLQDKKVHIWNTTTGGLTGSIDADSQITGIVWSTEYKEFITTHGFPNNQLTVWKYPTFEKITELEGHDNRVLHTARSPDGQTVVTAAADDCLKFWEVWKDKDDQKTKKKKKAEVEDLLNPIGNMMIR